MPEFSTVAVLMGGPSSEHEVSLKSGQAVCRALDEMKVSNRGYVLTESQLPVFDPKPDVVFIALHGKYGEDGQVQRELEQAGLLFTGSDSSTSSITMDKWATKEVMWSLDIPTPEAKILKKGETCSIQGEIVVKPISDGSSVGIQFLKSSEEISQTCEALFSQYESLLVEQRITGRECTVGILGKEALPIVEIVPNSGWYDFKSKYTAGESRYEVPADLPEELTARIQKEALLLFERLSCSGFARIDVLIDSSNQPWFLEVNTIPGLTPTSLLPKAAAAVGVDFHELILRMLNYAFSESEK